MEVVVIDDEFYFVCPDARLENTDVSDAKTVAIIKDAGIAWSELAALESLSCWKVLLIGTSHSAAVVNDVLKRAAAGRRDAPRGGDRPLSYRRMFVLAAAAANEAAYKHDSWGHGAFCKSLLAALDGAADGMGNPSTRDGIITFEELAR